MQLTGGVTPAAVEAPAVGSLLRLALACFLNVSMQSVAITSVTDASGVAAPVAAADDVNAAQQPGPCPSAASQRRRGLEAPPPPGYAAATGPGLLRALGSGTTAVMLAVSLSSCTTGGSSQAPPALSPDLLARLAALANSSSSSSSSSGAVGGGGNGPALGSFISAVAARSGVPAGSVTSAVSAGPAVAVSPSPSARPALQGGGAAASAAGSGGSAGLSPALVGGAAGGGILLVCALLLCVGCVLLRRRKQHRAAQRAKIIPGSGRWPHGNDGTAVSGVNPAHALRGSPASALPLPPPPHEALPQAGDSSSAFSHKSPLQRVKRTFDPMRPVVAVDDTGAAAAESSHEQFASRTPKQHSSLASLRQSTRSLGRGDKEQAEGAEARSGALSPDGNAARGASRFSGANPLRPSVSSASTVAARTVQTRNQQPRLSPGPRGEAGLDGALSASNPLRPASVPASSPVAAAAAASAVRAAQPRLLQPPPLSPLGPSGAGLDGALSASNPLRSPASVGSPVSGRATQSRHQQLPPLSPLVPSGVCLDGALSASNPLRSDPQGAISAVTRPAARTQSAATQMSFAFANPVSKAKGAGHAGGRL